ncbi:hypothetical protein VP01_11411g1, partial [Puccinia sorghi]
QPMKPIDQRFIPSFLAGSGRQQSTWRSAVPEISAERCQEDYELGWSKREDLAAAAAGKAADDAVKQAANDNFLKSQATGSWTVWFIGELFKLDMLTEQIMHECIKKLLSNIETPEEEDIESLSRLMMTVGGLLNHKKAISHMNIFFSRIQNMFNSSNLSSCA